MSIRIFLSAVLLLSLINPISAAAGKYPADVREFAKAKEAVLESLEALNEKASYLEKITYALQIGRLHEESLRLMLDISDRKKLVSQGEYVAAEDLAVRTAALESDIYKAIESESIQHLNTNTGPEHQEISYPLEEALKKKELAALADALLAYRMGLQNTESAQQKRLEEFQKSLTWKHKYASLIVITVLSLSISTCLAHLANNLFVGV